MTVTPAVPVVGIPSGRMTNSPDQGRRAQRLSMIPAGHIGLLAALYALEYFYRAVEQKERKYIYIGKALARAFLAVVYFYFAFFPTDAETRSIWIRLSLFMFFLIDLIFVMQERFAKRFIK